MNIEELNGQAIDRAEWGDKCILLYLKNGKTVVIYDSSGYTGVEIDYLSTQD